MPLCSARVVSDHCRDSVIPQIVIKRRRDRLCHQHGQPWYLSSTAAATFMWWSKKTLPPQPPAAEPVSKAEQKRLKKKCVAPLKALQSCKRANPDLPLAYARLESRAIECYAEVRALSEYNKDISWQSCCQSAKLLLPPVQSCCHKCHKYKGIHCLITYTTLNSTAAFTGVSSTAGPRIQGVLLAKSRRASAPRLCSQ